MARLLLGDDEWMTVDLEVCGSVLGSALEHEDAASVIRCAIIMALSALAAGDPWPDALLGAMGRFMSSMRDDVCRAQLM
jgi:hypothetical protein